MNLKFNNLWCTVPDSMQLNWHIVCIGNHNDVCQGGNSVFFGTNFSRIRYSQNDRIITCYRGGSQGSTSCNCTCHIPRSGVKIQASYSNSRGRLLQLFYDAFSFLMHPFSFVAVICDYYPSISFSYLSPVTCPYILMPIFSLSAGQESVS